MPNGIMVGGTGTFAAKPVDRNGNATPLPAGIVPLWKASDPNITIAPSPLGLSATVGVPLNFTPGQSFTLSVMATLPDATTPGGTLLVPLLAVEVAAFVISQSA